MNDQDRVVVNFTTSADPTTIATLQDALHRLEMRGVPRDHRVWVHSSYAISRATFTVEDVPEGSSNGN